MLPTEEGAYIARPREWTLGESKNGAVEFTVKFTLSQWLDGRCGEWQDIAADGYEIIGRFYPINKKGELVEMTMETLQTSLGWSGNTLRELADNDWSKVEVQLVLQHEEYEGKKTLKVKFMNPRDYVGGSGIKPADPQVVQTLDNKYGAALRANPKAKKPATAAAAPGNGSPQISEAEKERRLAYNAVATKFKPETEEKKKAIWLELTRDYFKTKPQQMVTAQEWREFVKNEFMAPAPANPISETAQFKEADIPF